MKNKIRVLRAMREITQEELADALGVTRQTIIAIEKGKYDPSLPLALGIARFFNLPVEKIFLFDDDAGTATSGLVP
jgi:putative transcriptional regulator